tara:strand:- start:433 stop:1383 length:951 start_codon:yes stop_codon:yes gene_type:complete
MHNIIIYIWYKLPKFILIFLLPLSGIYLIIIIIRKYFLTNIFPRYKAQSVLLIIGNLNVGGSGKTPFTIWLANYLKNKEKKVAIVSSGYGSNVTSPQRINNDSTSEMVGDEAILLYEKTLSTVISSNNRVQSTKYIDNNKYDFIIHDDGLQHYSLERKYEFILKKHDSDKNNNYLLPCGPIREPKSFHPNAQYILSNYQHNDVPGFNSQLIRIRSGKSGNYYELNDKKFLNATLVTAIADNATLMKELEKYNVTLKYITFPDHHQFKENDMPLVNEPILVTEKDFVKIKSFNMENIYILEQKIYPNDKLIKIIEEL